MIIFPLTFFDRAGHVGVITKINIEKGYVEIAEQNSDNRWEDPKEYSRRLVLIFDNLYTITNRRWNENVHCNIKENKLESEVLEWEKDNVIGWKRVGELLEAREAMEEMRSKGS